MEYLSKGKRGVVYTTERDGRKIAVKKKRSDSQAEMVLKKEAEFLKKLNKEGIGPEFIELEDDALVMEFVEGETIEEFLKNRENDRKEVIQVLKSVFDQCRTMDELRINKQEMTNPYKHIIIDKDLHPVIIDFERCLYTKKPKNVTQFCQYVTRTRTRQLLADRGITIDKNKIRKLAKEYKEKLSEKSYSRILSSIT